ncbi:hypothetical protein K7N18_33250, partial [Burkholderia arboris]|uniref:hypothetical protein n=1 Tax=Burkholderia arboris TaxID=488730 RepID=UPI001CA3E7CF
TLGDLLDCFDLELIRVPLAAHTDLLGCHKLWLEDVYERLAGPVEQLPRFGRVEHRHLTLLCSVARASGATGLYGTTWPGMIQSNR